VVYENLKIFVMWFIFARPLYCRYPPFNPSMPRFQNSEMITIDFG